MELVNYKMQCKGGPNLEQFTNDVISNCHFDLLRFSVFTKCVIPCVLLIIV